MSSRQGKTEIDKAMDMMKALERRELRAKECVMYCDHHKRGTHDNVLNWMTGEGTPGGVGHGTVDPQIEDQGRCAACWAFVSGRGAHSAFKCVGHEDIPPFAIQDIIDHTYPGARGCQGGNPLVALQYMKINGVREENDYQQYTGLKPDQTPPHTEGRKHQLRTWCLAEDNEESMMLHVGHQPWIVSIPLYAGVVLLEGVGFLDLFLAEKYDDPEVVKKHFDDNDQLDESPEFHNMLLVGYGTYRNKLLDYPPINYWIVKNQWTKEWGDKGLAYIIRNSTLSVLHERDGGSTSEGGEVTTHRLFTPSIPRPRHVDEEELEEGEIHVDEDDVVSAIITNQQPGFLKDMVYYNEDAILFYAFYDPGYCERNNIYPRQEMVALEKAYLFDEKIVAMVDLTLYPDSYRWFQFGAYKRLELIVFQAKQGRSLSDGMRFPIRTTHFDFGNIIRWLGDQCNMAPIPTIMRD